jgi:Cdc6-like AAA superfamily ATPase
MFVTKSYSDQKDLNTFFQVKIDGGKNSGKEISFVDTEDVKGVNNKKILGPSVKLNEGVFKLLPKERHNKELKREVHYIAGPAGSGKTYQAIKILREYKKKFPENNIIFVSTVNDNKELKKLKPFLINITDPNMIKTNFFDEETKIRFISNPEADFEDQKCEFADSIIVFDDLEAITDKRFEKVLYEELINPALSIGRHFRTSVIMIKHQLLDYNKTRTLLLEMDFLHVFPQTQRRQIRNCLQNYIGLEKDVIDLIMNEFKTRCLIVHTKYPQALITHDSLYAL